LAIPAPFILAQQKVRKIPLGPYQKQEQLPLYRRMEKDSACSTYRPTVYEPGPRGLIAKWRGPALELPLLDAVLVPGEAAAVCALHKGDFFISHNLKKTFVLRLINGMVSVSGYFLIRKSWSDSRALCRWVILR
jgi:hypothetical protein